jgi:sec-independent protein translocase protein TatA
MGAIAPWHIIVLILLILLVVGSKKLPEAGRGLGQSIREFKHGVMGERRMEPLPEDASPPDDDPVTPTPEARRTWRAAD